MGSSLPDPLIHRLAEILRQASQLYRYDVESTGGTTATAVAGASEELAYWAFDLLVSTAASAPNRGQPDDDGGREDDGEGARSNAGQTMMPALLQRFEETLRRFVQDVRLRGRLPFERSVLVP